MCLLDTQVFFRRASLRKLETICLCISLREKTEMRKKKKKGKEKRQAKPNREKKRNTQRGRNIVAHGGKLGEDGECVIVSVFEFDWKTRGPPSERNIQYRRKERRHRAPRDPL